MNLLYNNKTNAIVLPKNYFVLSILVQPWNNNSEMQLRQLHDFLGNKNLALLNIKCISKMFISEPWQLDFFFLHLFQRQSWITVHLGNYWETFGHFGKHQQNTISQPVELKPITADINKVSGHLQVVIEYSGSDNLKEIIDTIFYHNQFLLLQRHNLANVTTLFCIALIKEQ